MKILKVLITSVFSLFVGTGFALAQQQSNELMSALGDLQNLNGRQVSSLLNSVGMGTGSSSGFSLTTIFAYLIFGSIGFVAFVYGKKQASFKPLVIGIVLMGYPYFVTNPIWLYAVGVGLTVLLFVWRD